MFAFLESIYSFNHKTESKYLHNYTEDFFFGLVKNQSEKQFSVQF